VKEHHCTLLASHAGAAELPLSGNTTSTNHAPPLSGETSRDRKQTPDFPITHVFSTCGIFQWLLGFAV